MAEATDIESQVRQNLLDAGCSDEITDQFMYFLEAANPKDGLCLLLKHRQSLLDTIHKNQKRIDCLDFLLYKLKL